MSPPLCHRPSEERRAAKQEKFLLSRSTPGIQALAIGSSLRILYCQCIVLDNGGRKKEAVLFFPPWERGTQETFLFRFSIVRWFSDTIERQNRLCY
jgi:hypothetical protein